MIYFAIASGIYIISFWVPTLIKQTGVTDPLHIGLLTAVPYIVAIVAMILTNAHADRVRERRWHTMIPMLLTAVGLVVTALAIHDTVIAMVGLTLAAAGASTCQSVLDFPSELAGRSGCGSRHRVDQFGRQYRGIR